MIFKAPSILFCLTFSIMIYAQNSDVECIDFVGITSGDPDFALYFSSEANVELSPANIIASGVSGTNSDYSVIGLPDASCKTLDHNISGFTKLLSKWSVEELSYIQLQQIFLDLYIFTDSETKVIGKIWNFNTASWEIFIEEEVSASAQVVMITGTIMLDNPDHYSNQGTMYTKVYNVDPNANPNGSPAIPAAVLCVDYHQLCVPVGTIPTLSQWGLIILSMLLAIIGIFGIRAHKAFANSSNM